MTMHEWTDKLSDYLDGELDADERVAVDAHLRECAECSATLNDLKRVVSTAHGLAAIPPSHDLWPGIESRIERVPAQHRVSFTITQLAAAAVVLMAVSAGIAVKFVAPAMSTASATLPSTQAARTPSTPAPEPDAVPVALADAQYDAAVADLEKAVRAGRGHLDASTITIVENNLKIIDQAIMQARDALAADPANAYLSDHLIEARRRKLDLLRRAAALSETN